MKKRTRSKRQNRKRELYECYMNPGLFASHDVCLWLLFETAKMSVSFGISKNDFISMCRKAHEAVTP